ncbi:cytochrome P450 3A17 [Boeremia exigua]|uniref:cytochrome P450 3A17 n=1 Tax=Boeremia exigua TaxID=749465 RepID=UPI001E8DFFAD|nr:cytochrome P450 3A17 [Boeremia exigua]KAH6613096.1 cytochrome P450 3A17 [Boeremia exigua]
MPSVHLVAAILLAIVGYMVKILLAAQRSSLSKLPGTWHSRYTDLVLRFYTLSGRRIFYVDGLHQTYGDVIRITPDQVAVADIVGVSQIHKIGSGFLKSNFYMDLTPTREPGIFAMQNAHDHAARRKLFARAFSNSALKTNWEAEIRRKTTLAVSRIKDDATQRGKGADVLKWWTLMATDVITHLSFGDSFGMLEQGKQTSYIDALQAALLGGVLRAEFPLMYTILRFIPLKGVQRMVTADDMVYEHGAVAIHNMRDGQGNNMNLFGQMLAASDDYEKVGLTDKAVREEAGNLIVAGSDTTAVTLTYLVYAVLKDPELQARLEQEVVGLSDQLNMTELESAPVLNSVIEETLRLYGAAPGALPRIVPSQGFDVAGYRIPPGIEVSTQAYTLHRDPRIFQEPLRFDSNRFMDKSKLSTQQKAAYMPFGAGSRTCLGIHLAYLELRLATAMFFRDCRGARLSDCMRDEMMEMDNRFLIAPKGRQQLRQ